jgi:hypothetical protein
MSEIMPVTIEALELYAELDEKGAENYFRARQRKGFLEREFTSKFDANVKAFQGYTDERVPTSEITSPVPVGDFVFHVKATPSTKRPGYEEVFTYLRETLEEVLRNYHDGIRASGVLTIDGQPYIAMDTVKEKIQRKRDDVTQNGVKLEIVHVDIPDVLSEEDVSSLSVPIGNGFIDLKPGNAANYIRAKRLIELYTQIAKEFEDNLVDLTGYSNANPPEDTQHLWQTFGSHIFHVPTIPYPSPSYGQMVNRLVKKTQRNTKTTGDLVLIEREIEKPELEVYAARTRNGQKYISIQGALARMGGIQETYTGIKVRQKPINHYPLV